MRFGEGCRTGFSRNMVGVQHELGAEDKRA